MSPSLRWSLVLALVAAVCVVAPRPAAHAQETDATSEQSETPSADALARDVVDRTGDPSKLERLAFTFVVEVDGEEKARRRHVWRPQKGVLEVERDGETTRLQQLGKHDPSDVSANPAEHRDIWKKIAPDAEPKAAADAWAKFINDSYWLLAPAKLFDPGVHRKLDAKGRLVLTFGDTGLTPGDRYTLTIDRERDVVTAWRFELESGRTGSFEWGNYKKFGPLFLATRRVSESDGEKPKVVIRFEEIEAR